MARGDGRRRQGAKNLRWCSSFSKLLTSRIMAYNCCDGVIRGLLMTDIAIRESESPAMAIGGPFVLHLHLPVDNSAPGACCSRTPGY